MESDFLIEKPNSLTEALKIFKFFPNYLGSKQSNFQDSVPVEVTMWPLSMVKQYNLIHLRLSYNN